MSTLTFLDFLDVHTIGLYKEVLQDLVEHQRSYFWIMKNCVVKTFGFSIADFMQVQRILGDVDHTYFIAEFSRASGRS